MLELRQWLPLGNTARTGNAVGAVSGSSIAPVHPFSRLLQGLAAHHSQCPLLLCWMRAILPGSYAPPLETRPRLMTNRHRGAKGQALCLTVKLSVTQFLLQSSLLTRAEQSLSWTIVFSVL